MSNAVARRYAKGLLQAALQLDETGQDPEAVASQLEALAGAVARFDSLRLVLANPAIDPSRKAAVLDEVAERQGAGRVTRRLLGVLAANDRLDQIQPLARAFRTAVDRHLGVVDAQVTTPVALDADEVETLREKLAAATGQTVRISTRTDPELLGGLVTRIGDVVYDGSLRHQLARIRRQMVSS